jgi:hypothetical protein
MRTARSQYASLALVAVGLIGIALVLLLSACGSSATSDRPDSAGGKNPDTTAAATRVTVYLNADDVPNVALFCIGEMRFASTLSGGDSGKDKSSALLRLPEQDGVCGAAPR